MYHPARQDASRMASCCPRDSYTHAVMYSVIVLSLLSRACGSTIVLAAGAAVALNEPSSGQQAASTAVMATNEPPIRHQVFRAYAGATPTVDGVISRKLTRLEPKERKHLAHLDACMHAAGEWDDAFEFVSSPDWVSEFSPARNISELSIRAGFIKHDATHLYFAFDVVDDVRYAVDTPRWLPTGNPNATELTPQGWPCEARENRPSAYKPPVLEPPAYEPPAYEPPARRAPSRRSISHLLLAGFGDELEIILNAAAPPSRVSKAARTSNVPGNATAWQMVLNSGKSRLGGIGVVSTARFSLTLDDGVVPAMG